MAEKEKTAPCVPTAIGTEQPLQMDCTNSIAENSADFNSFEDNFELMMKRMLDPTYLPTISMTELYNNIYDKKQPLIDGLLYAGVYLFVGAPKVGKSFFMLQLAYHVSTGTNLWNYTVRKERYCTLRWRTITAVCRNACTECSGLKILQICISPLPLIISEKV